MDYDKKASIVCVLMVLKKYSDENHHLTQQEIIDHVEKDYGVTIKRKSVAISLNLLGDLFDFNINKCSQGEDRGFALINDGLDDSEIKYLIDSVYSSRSLSPADVKDIVNNLTEDLSIYKKEEYRYHVTKATSESETTPTHIFQNIDVINNAIRKKKMIRFKYLNHNEKGILVPKDKYYSNISPLWLVNSFGIYYFLGNYHNKPRFSTFRVNYMADIEIDENSVAADPLEIEGLGAGFSIDDYVKEHIYMFNGEMAEIKMKVLKTSSIKYLYDYFGKIARFECVGDDLYCTLNADIIAFQYWICQYADGFEVISPKSVRNFLYNFGKNLSEKYGPKTK